MGLAGGVFGDDGEDDLAQVEALEALLARDELAAGREDGGDADEVQRGDAGVAQGELEAGEALSMLAHTLGQEEAGGDHVHAQWEDPPWEMRGCGAGRRFGGRCCVERVKVITAERGCGRQRGGDGENAGKWRR